MTDLARLHDFSGDTGDPISSVAMDAELDQLVAAVNPLYAAYRTLHVAAGVVASGDVSGDKFFADDAFTENLSVAVPSGVPGLYLAAADFGAPPNRTAKLRMRAQCYVNNAAPGITLAVGLYPLSAVGGGVAGSPGDFLANLGAVVAGSQVTFASPALGTLAQGDSGDFALPADGHYLLGVNLSGSVPVNNTRVNLSAQLQQHWV